MRRPGFLQGAGVGVVLALAGAGGFAALSLLLAPLLVVKLLIALLGGAYSGWLLLRSPRRVGRLSLALLWCAGAAAAWLLPGLALYLATHLGLLWLIRCGCFHAGVLPALADLALGGAALLAALAAWQQSRSLFLTLWTYFLVQALFVLIPARVNGRRHAPQRSAEQRFDRALGCARGALRRLDHAGDVM